jgi:hypothetical protein
LDVEAAWSVIDFAASRTISDDPIGLPNGRFDSEPRLSRSSAAYFAGYDQRLLCESEPPPTAESYGWQHCIEQCGSHVLASQRIHFSRSSIEADFG